MLLPAVAVLSAGGCAVGPDFRRPAAPAVAAYVPGPPPPALLAAGGAGQRLQPGSEVPSEWWRAFGSPALDALVEEARRANPDLAAAEATLSAARELAAAQRGAFWPQLGVGGSALRGRDATGVVQGTLQSGQPVYTLYNAQATVSFVPDLFGANRRQVESLAAAADRSAAARDAAWLTLTGNVVTAAVQSAGIAAQIDATERLLRLQREALEILRRKLSLGAIPEADVVAQQAALAQAEATLPALARQREQARHLLAVLTGRLPAEAPAVAITLDGLTPPAEVPLGVPAELVRRRPDVRAAEAALHQATAEVGVADAALLPELSLAGLIGATATGTGDLFRAGTRFWSGSATLTQALFEGGALVHRRRAAVANLDAAGAQYRSAVLAGFRDVADALRALEADVATEEAVDREAVAAEQSLAIARRQLELGAVSYLQLVSAEQTALQASIGRLQARAARLADTAALFQALGGRPARE
jgi:NodT family efflux transporter outer membrane factor (OMF) lipoprotein